MKLSIIKKNGINQNAKLKPVDIDRYKPTHKMLQSKLAK